MKKILFISVIGQTIEFFDFVTIVLLAKVISANFFDSKSLFCDYLLLYFVFALGYIIRPIGGVIFGHFGDKIGRKKTFVASIFLIALSTTCIAFIPPISEVGLISPIFFVFFRLLQGISLGGELPGAISLVYEHSKKYKTYNTSMISSGAYFGFLLASVSIVLLSLVSKNSIYWSWRILFISSGLAGFIVCLLRYKLSETPIFLEMIKDKKILKYPISGLFTYNYFNSIVSLFVILFGIYGTIFMFVFPELLSNYFHYYSHFFLYMISTCSILILVVFTPIFGKYIDKVNINIYLWFCCNCLLIIALLPLIFICISSRSDVLIIVAYLLFAITCSSTYSVVFRIISGLYPNVISYTGLAMCLNIGAIFSTGIVPILSMLLLKHNNLDYICYLLVGCVTISMIFVFLKFLINNDSLNLDKLDKKIRKKYKLFENIAEIEVASVLKSLNDIAKYVSTTELIYLEEKMKAVKIDFKNIDKLSEDKIRYLHDYCNAIFNKNIKENSALRKYIDCLEGDYNYFLYFLTKVIQFANSKNKIGLGKNSYDR